VRFGGGDCRRTLKVRLLRLNPHHICPVLSQWESCPNGVFYQILAKKEEKSKKIHFFEIFVEIDLSILVIIVKRQFLLSLLGDRFWGK
jgi:hypothetical protein